ncbi:hypothetical protein V6O07_03770, partial [Arthrospira platensis SPKY2]
SMTLRIHEWEDPHSNAHLSIMARRSTAARSALVSFAARGDDRHRHYSAFVRADDDSTFERFNRHVIAFAPPPNRFFRLERRGELFTFSASRDGLSYDELWTLHHSEPGAYELGIALNSNNPNLPTRVVFSIEDFRNDPHGDGSWDSHTSMVTPPPTAIGEPVATLSGSQHNHRTGSWT